MTPAYWRSQGHGPFVMERWRCGLLLAYTLEGCSAYFGDEAKKKWDCPRPSEPRSYYAAQIADTELQDLAFALLGFVFVLVFIVLCPYSPLLGKVCLPCTLVRWKSILCGWDPIHSSLLPNMGGIFPATLNSLHLNFPAVDVPATVRQNKSFLA